MPINWYVYLCMGVGRGGKGAVAPWIFIHDTDKVEGGLMVLFFGLVLCVTPLPGNFSADVLGPQMQSSWRVTRSQSMSGPSSENGWLIS